MTTARPGEAELRWKCRRGMLELDILLNRYLDRAYARLDSRKTALLLQLLDYPDQVLQQLLVNGEPSADPALTALIAEIRSPSDDH